MLRVGQPILRLSVLTNQDSENNAMLVAHAYRAQTDGMVYVYTTSGSDDNGFTAYIGNTSDPAGAGNAMAGHQNNTLNRKSSAEFEVAEDEYFEIVKAGTCVVTIYWRSKGILQKPIDYN